MSSKSPAKVRLDQLLTESGLAESRTKAQALIMAGLVMVDGRKAQKAGDKFPAGVSLSVEGPDHPYVSRGGLKLKKALDHFNVDVTGAVCLDAGASTGGFTHCLLIEGAEKVYAVDVGYGQLHLRLRNDPRVMAVERCNVRYLSNDTVPEPVDIITADLSFISLTMVMERLSGFLKEGGRMLLLVKPQFEAPRGSAKKGVVRDSRLREDAVESVMKFGASLGLEALGYVESPIKGPSGNIEYITAFLKPPFSCPEGEDGQKAKINNKEA